ncbi:MAG: RNA 2',3'-cyclic phosphodiesterase [Phycisphaeraceae bacterium]
MPDLRTFIAVNVSPTKPLVHILGRLADLGRPIRTVKGDHLHLTLQFRGPTDPAEVPAIEAAIRDAVTAADARPFDLPLQGLGAFPNDHRPNVIWVGCPDPGPLPQIVSHLPPPNTQPQDAIPQARNWQPHLTLARIKRRPGKPAGTPRGLIDLLSAHRQTVFGSARINSIILFASELRPDGPEYTALATLGLPSPQTP